MNEERILHLSEKSMMWLQTVLEEAYMGDCGVIPDEFFANELMIKGWLDLELAPPKDFKPKCHDHVTSTWIQENSFKVFYECDSCDIREQCIYKRE